jgi:hypothetical protein
MNKTAPGFVGRGEPEKGETTMKTKIILASIFAAASGLTALAPSARADTVIRASIGGFGAPVAVAPAYCPPAPVVVNAGYRVEPRGYWQDVTVKTWVPAQWIVTRDYRGFERRTFAPAHLAFHTERVWVEAGRGFERHDDDRSRAFERGRDDDRDHNRDRGYGDNRRG